MRRALLVAVALALGTPATALADEFSLTISAPGSGAVGQPMLLHGNGHTPLAYVQYSHWFSAHVIPAAVMSTCPSDHYEAWQIAVSTGGAYLTHAQKEKADANGDFSVPFGLTPWAPGDYIVCAYSDDGYTNTVARAQHDVHVAGAAPAPPSAVATPANTAKPRVKRAGRRLSVTRHLRGHKVRCRVTASNAGGATSAVSRAVRVSRAPRHR